MSNRVLQGGSSAGEPHQSNSVPVGFNDVDLNRVIPMKMGEVLAAQLMGEEASDGGIGVEFESTFSSLKRLGGTF